METWIIEDVTFDGLDLHLPVSDKEILTAIANFTVIILKKAFDPSIMATLKQSFGKFARNNQPSNPDIVPGIANFYRIDHNPEKSQVKRISRSFTSFYWCEQDIAGERPYVRAMARLRNRLIEVRADYAFTQVEDGYVGMPNILHYPRGGGYLQTHTDPPSKQKVVVTAILSERGKDYHQGGLYVEDFAGNRLLIDDYLDPGDIYLINPAIRHGVAPIDPTAPLDWMSDEGRWMMFSTLIPYTSLFGIKTTGLKTY